MINYLYYKLYQASLKSSLRDIPEFFAPAMLGGLLSANTLVISALLSKFGLAPFIFANSMQGKVYAFLLIVATMIYYRKKRYEPILKKYSHENEKARKIGNAIVAIYVAVSFLSIFAVAFFKPGKL